jgi:hypothetical protein
MGAGQRYSIQFDDGRRASEAQGRYREQPGLIRVISHNRRLPKELESNPGYDQIPLLADLCHWWGTMQFRSIILSILVLRLIVCSGMQAHAEKRVALVIGNGAYRFGSSGAAGIFQPFRRKATETKIHAGRDGGNLRQVAIRAAPGRPTTIACLNVAC